MRPICFAFPFLYATSCLRASFSNLSGRTASRYWPLMFTHLLCRKKSRNKKLMEPSTHRTRLSPSFLHCASTRKVFFCSFKFWCSYRLATWRKTHRQSEVPSYARISKQVVHHRTACCALVIKYGIDGIRAWTIGTRVSAYCWCCLILQRGKIRMEGTRSPYKRGTTATIDADPAWKAFVNVFVWMGKVK